MSCLNKRLHISYTVTFLCFHSLFVYSYIEFHSLYNKDITLNIWCAYFPEVPFLLLFSEHIPLQILLSFIDRMAFTKEIQSSLSYLNYCFQYFVIFLIFSTNQNHNSINCKEHLVIIFSQCFLLLFHFWFLLVTHTVSNSTS